MAIVEHTIETNWRENDATALEERVLALNQWLDHTEDIIEMLEGDKEVVIALRSLAGLIRSRRDDIGNEASKLRAALVRIK